MSGDRLFPPSEKGRRNPTSNQKVNGNIHNPPRFPEMGGFESSRGHGVHKNPYKITPTGK